MKPGDGKVKSDEVKITIEHLKLANEYVLARLHIGRWRARKSLKLLDLGIPHDQQAEIENGLLSLGQKSLLPVIPETSAFYQDKPRTYADLLISIEQSARQRLDREAFRLIWGKAIKITRLPMLVADLEELRVKYFTVRDEIVADWDRIIAKLVSEYTKFAKASAVRIAKLSDGQYSEALFEEAFLREIQSSIPTRDGFAESFYFDIEVAAVDTSGWFDEMAKERALRELRTNPALAAERDAYEAALAERNRILRQMNQEIRSAAEEFKQAIIFQSRSALYATALDILGSLKEKRAVSSGTARRLAQMVEICERTFSSDVEAQQLRNATKLLLDADPAPSEVEKIVMDIAMIARESLLSSDGAEIRSGRDVGLPDYVPQAEVERARREIAELSALQQAERMARSS